MKIKLFAGISVLAFSLICPSMAEATQTVDSTSLKKTFKDTRAFDLPALAAEIVSQASLTDREAVAEAVVRAALDVRPTSAPALVAAISRAVPSVAPVAVATALEIEPKLGGAVVKAAAAAAPKQADKIVQHVSEKFPKHYRLAAVAAAEGAPAATPEIFAAVGSSVPSLRQHVETMIKAGNPAQSSMQDLVSAAEQLAGIPQPAPGIGGPFVPGGGTPGELNRNQTVIVTPGQGREYSR